MRFAVGLEEPLANVLELSPLRHSRIHRCIDVRALRSCPEYLRPPAALHRRRGLGSAAEFGAIAQTFHVIFEPAPALVRGCECEHVERLRMPITSATDGKHPLIEIV